MNFGASYRNLEHSPLWTEEFGITINSKTATGRALVRLPSGLRMFCSGDAYAGWLAKHVLPLVYPFPRITLSYVLMVDDATAQCAQVVETDSKITDAAGYTYDLSAQWNLAEGWMFQVDDGAGHWVDTGIQIAPLAAYTELTVEIDYELDYVNRVSAIAAVVVNSKEYPAPATLGKIPAKAVGWGPSKIVTQLQQCINGQPGAYSIEFADINYDLSE